MTAAAVPTLPASAAMRDRTCPAPTPEQWAALRELARGEFLMRFYDRARGGRPVVWTLAARPVNDRFRNGLEARGLIEIAHSFAVRGASVAAWRLSAKGREIVAEAGASA
jgi:hypothetical protein